MPTLTLGTAECACGGTIVLRVHESRGGSSRKYADCKECGLAYWPDVVRRRNDFKDRFSKPPSKPPHGVPSDRAVAALSTAQPIDPEAKIDARVTFEFEGPVVATLPHTCSRCAGIIEGGDLWWECGGDVVCDDCKQEVIARLQDGAQP